MTVNTNTTQEYNTPFTMDSEEYMRTRFVSVEEAVAFEKAAVCMQQCQLPVDIVKRIMGSNFKEIENNIKSCVKHCQTSFIVESGNQKNMAQHADLFSEEIFECKKECLEKNKQIANELELSLAKDFLEHKQSLFDMCKLDSKY